MASNTEPTARPFDHSSLPQSHESYKLGLLIDPTSGEITHALDSPVGSRSRSPVKGAVETSGRSLERADSHHTSAPSTHHITPSTSPSEKSQLSESTESVLTPVSDAMAQDQVGPRGSLQHLSSQKFTLTVPSDKAVAIGEILAKIRDDFELDSDGIDCKTNNNTKKPADERQREHEKQVAAANEAIYSAVENTLDSPSKKVSFTHKWAARIAKIQPLSLSYADVRFDEIIDHAVRTWWRGLANNLYHLPPAFYFLVFLGLTAWAFGSIVCGYFEATARLTANDKPGAWPAFWRGTLGAIPALTGIITFLFPPTFCVRYR
ncbi:hypothetical protein J1614_011816 [Plenodomus biglobosus]|nr:hypothetical protein J1614_011816 [Plenodomus biglobosus]